MYVALWRVLPGPRWARILILVGAVVAIVTLLSFFVFPWVDILLTRSEDVRS